MQQQGVLSTEINPAILNLLSAAAPA